MATPTCFIALLSAGLNTYHSQVQLSNGATFTDRVRDRYIGIVAESRMHCEELRGYAVGVMVMYGPGYS